ncbi:MAG: MarR family transcriptional regulator [Cyclobacteriaceae bacterium]|nr:MarR family transcriptional regulator [Cyclobacteriaceae bacterium]
MEKIGIYFEHSMPPAAARILALLIVSDQDSFCFDDIRANLNLSKSATSNGINALLGVNKIEYYTKTGDRKRYFKWKPNSTIGHFKTEIEKILGLNILLEDALHLKKDKDSHNAQMLAELSDLMHYLYQETSSIYELWRTNKQQIQ